MALKQSFLDEIHTVLPSDAVRRTNLEAYGRDETDDFYFEPQIVVYPRSGEETARILALCNSHQVPVTCRGGGTGLSGGALPVRGGLVLSTDRLNRILHIDTANLQVTVEPGVITQVLQEAVAEHGLYYPPDPSSRGTCTLGGNLAESAGGPHAFKYGTTKDYVLNLQVALMDGSLIWTGANVTKYATGYHLTQLMVGSEGTLGVITQAVLKLIPAPGANLLLSVPFNDLESACRSVSAIQLAGLKPSAVEFMEKEALELSASFLGMAMPFPSEVVAELLIELDGDSLDQLYPQAERLSEILEKEGAGEIRLADQADAKEMLWRLRRQIGHAVRAYSVYKEEDTVVPMAALPTLMVKVKALCADYGVRSVCYGHAGDGNIHVNLLKEQHSDKYWKEILPQMIRELFEEVRRLGGTLSGEHGIGWSQKGYVDVVMDPVQIQLMKGIKTVFDPQGLLNPGKIWEG
ncbi:MAG: FAD-binding protein [Sphingomonadales bacterium]|nr:FAD-binding protein [Sphingomonadales bacterium]